ncbi:Aste57867_8981 [Aphanomyces stellatus]|uniref:Aste57867_8981 protein n=1 Tax=Aphanomyces stellatus TaxID=120398 RepID=A0A485KM10_9STRA|nr:hypothetical protein As57867_008946 [Aphanomyces stellatus]VFT85865.1 Aste57867_8981 [Aphanomyces stellatus]
MSPFSVSRRELVEQSNKIYAVATYTHSSSSTPTHKRIQVTTAAEVHCDQQQTPPATSTNLLLQQIILMDRYTIQKTIADALYGQIVLAHDALTDDVVAIKKVNVAAATAHTVVRGNHRHVAEDIDMEKQVHRRLSANGGHPNVLRLRGDFVDHGYDHLVFDFCAGGDLFSRLDDGALPLGVAQRYFGQLVQGVGYMHAQGVAHRDLSLENVLIYDDKCCVCDFGLAVPTSATCKDTVGKPFYMAPEVVQGIEYDPAKADVWSLGIMLFMLLSGIPLWQIAAPKDPLFAFVKKQGLRRVTTAWNLRLDDTVMELLEGMLCMDLTKRFSLAQVAAHAFVKDCSTITNEAQGQPSSVKPFATKVVSEMIP